MFRKSQQFYDAIYAWKDYPAEVERLVSIIRERSPQARSLLDVACGTGKHLELLRELFRVEGVDLDPEMIALSRQRLGAEAPLHVGDMTELHLGRTFDVVTCLFSSIGYVRSRDAAPGPCRDDSARVPGRARHRRALVLPGRLDPRTRPCDLRGPGRPEGGPDVGLGAARRPPHGAVRLSRGHSPGRGALRRGPRHGDVHPRRLRGFLPGCRPRRRA